jgi:hypothetical protein
MIYLQLFDNDVEIASASGRGQAAIYSINLQLVDDIVKKEEKKSAIASVWIIYIESSHSKTQICFASQNRAYKH